MRQEVNISELLGKTIVNIKGLYKDNDEIIFTLDNGDQYKMYHEQDCCESVLIDDVNGHVGGLLNSPITLAEESTNREDNSPYGKNLYDDSFTWTFYKLATIKGYVDIKWLGESNGYYSESVDFVKL